MNSIQIQRVSVNQKVENILTSKQENRDLNQMNGFLDKKYIVAFSYHFTCILNSNLIIYTDRFDLTEICHRKFQPVFQFNPLNQFHERFHCCFKCRINLHKSSLIPLSRPCKSCISEPWNFYDFESESFLGTRCQ